ncbi:MAG: ribose ABC transporter permease [Planctomycetes bacterium]|nr:ribose ABC transporter permease [Planctomycetota bacterium]
MNAKAQRLDLSNIATVGVLLVLVIILSVLTPAFLRPANLINILQQITINAIISVGMTVVILTGGIDLSVGSIIALVGMICAKLMVTYQMNAVLVMIIGLLVGALVGFLNGFLVASCRLQPMIATLGTMSIARGLALTIAQGRTVSCLSPTFRWLGNATVPGTSIPVQIILMLLLFSGLFYLLRYRKSGRYIYGIGGNEESTRLSGIDTKYYKILAYVICSACAALAAIVQAAKLNSAVGTAGEGYELNAIASTVIGGTSLVGGHGGVWGTLLGAIIIGVIRNGLNLLNVSSYLQKVVIGVIILTAVLVDAFRVRAMSGRK